MNYVSLISLHIMGGHVHTYTSQNRMSFSNNFQQKASQARAVENLKFSP